jgi:hypothetical protein
MPRISINLLWSKVARRLLCAAFFCGAAMSSANAQQDFRFLVRGPIAIDLLGGVEWMRCSIGQVWVDGRCEGEVLRAPYASAAAVIERAAASSGAGWRLPTLDELFRLVQMQETPPMIDNDIFPDTHLGSYWTSDENRFLAGNQWVVNFNTGYRHGRALHRQFFAFRLVRDR